MLLYLRWKHFWYQFFLGTLVFTSVIFVGSIILLFDAKYLDKDSIDTFVLIFKNKPYLSLIVICKILSVTLTISFCLQIVSSSLKLFHKFVFAITLVGAACLRYSWMQTSSDKISKQSSLIRFFLKSLHQESIMSHSDLISETLRWAPLGIYTLCLVASTLSIINFLSAQTERFNLFKRGIFVAQFDRESKRLSMGAVAIIFNFIIGIPVAYHLSDSHNISLPFEKSRQSRPHIFFFVIEGLPYQSLARPPQETSMLFVKNQTEHAALFKPLLMSSEENFPSFVEIATCKYSHRTGVDTIFPTRAVKISETKTLYETSKALGYAPFVVSNNSEDIFSKYNFGFDKILSPQITYETTLTNILLDGLPALDAIFAMPRLSPYLSSLLGVFRSADPRISTLALAEALSEHNEIGRPVFSTIYFKNDNFYSKHTDLKFKKIDDAIAEFWTQLEEKGWLTNSLIIVLGTPGAKTYEEKVHRPSVNPPLAIWVNGTAEDSIVLPDDRRLARGIDIVPTVARRIGLNIDFADCDGAPLLDLVDKQPAFPIDSAYQQSTLPIVVEGSSTESSLSVDEVLHADFTKPGGLSLDENTAAFLASHKTRFWINDRWRLAVDSANTNTGIRLYDRIKDPEGTDNILLKNTDFTRPIADELLRQLNEYLSSRGTEIIKLPRTTIYSEDTVQ